jgi:D-alanyl-D-alanine carboxypeptidase
MPVSGYRRVLIPLFALLWARGALPAQTGGPVFAARLEAALAAAEIPGDLAARIKDSTAFPAALEKALGGDQYLRILVDKRHPLPKNYEPDDLVELQYKSYRAGVSDKMMLRRAAGESLEEMAAAARAEGVTLVVSSAYRSYAYQIGSFERWTKRLGAAEAERKSARPGMSQHQLGLTVDFGSISDEFAGTGAGRWLKANAGRFGWSMSFPQGYEQRTGYAWESWHYRYVGTALAALIDTWFGGIQHYALSFIHEWERQTTTSP